MTLKDIVSHLKDSDFVESVEAGDKWWDIYKFKSPAIGKAMMALRIAPEGHVEIGGIGRSVDDVKAMLQKDSN